MDASTRDSNNEKGDNGQTDRKDNTDNATDETDMRKPISTVVKSNQAETPGEQKESERLGKKEISSVDDMHEDEMIKVSHHPVPSPTRAAFRCCFTQKAQETEEKINYTAKTKTRLTDNEDNEKGDNGQTDRKDNTDNATDETDMRKPISTVVKSNQAETPGEQKESERLGNKEISSVDDMHEDEMIEVLHHPVPSPTRADEPTINEEKRHTIAAETGENPGSTTGTEIEWQNQPLEDWTRSKTGELFQRLYLKNKDPAKMRVADVLQLTARSLLSYESCAEQELAHTFLHKLLMMNYRARHITVKNTNEEDHTQTDSCYSSKHENDFYKVMSLSNKQPSTSNPIHPMDVQMAVFHCADSFLKQLMVTKLSQCQYALPLLVPDPFTQHIEFPLWTFRQINKSWKKFGSEGEIISKVQSVCKAETPMVCFFRFGSVSSSKSHLMNSLINEKHNTFFHRNCPGSSRTRVLMDGVVEIAWYCPSGKNMDTFNDCVAFCNLHGDAGDHEKQLQILTEMSSVNVVVLECLDKQDRSLAKCSNFYKDKKPLICIFSQDESTVIEMDEGKYKIGLKHRNLSDVHEELRRAVNKCLSFSETSFIFRLEDVSKHSDIRVDEDDDEDCRRGKEAAQQMMKLLENKDLTEIKESFLPCQGKLWHQWCQKNKELHRPRGDDLEMEISRKKNELKKIREQQHKSGLSAFMKHYIKGMNSYAANKKIYFLKWLGVFLDEYTSADLSGLRHKYDEKWSTVLKLKDNNSKYKQLNSDKSKLTVEQRELEKISEAYQAATLGLEHILREIGQIYESCSSVKKNKEGLQVHFSSLPSLAAEMMISGFPLELMDGDAAHVPLIWISAVLDELIKKLGDQRVFVLSVLGIQSSGKSTMLNAMFGLQFAVSAGRCTRGAFMQLVSVSEQMRQMKQLKFDYILVVDTEGLRALELAGRSTRHHDNELATFVVGLGNLTLINIFGENLSDMQDILQIVVQAFLRMKKVRLKPSCMFVHQNVSDITAGEKNMEGRRRLLEKLDEMTKLAAKEEDCDAESFSDVIAFDVQNDVKYFAQIWEGSPPMAPPNPNYCTNIQELMYTILTKASKSSTVSLSEFKGCINSLWNALLNENFVFSFKNILEIAVYRKLETKYNDWTWKVRSAMLRTEEKYHNRIANGKVEVDEKDLLADMNKTKEIVQNSLVSYFEEDSNREILSQWRGRFETKISDLHDDLIKRAKRKLDEVIQQKKTREKLDGKKTDYENVLFSRSKELAFHLKNTEKDECVLKKEFDTVWSTWITELIKETPSVKDFNFWKDVTQILSENHEWVFVQKRQQERYYQRIDSLGDYSDYIMMKKNLEPSDQDQTPKRTDANSEKQEDIPAMQKSKSIFSIFKDLNPFSRKNATDGLQNESQNNALLKTNALLPEDHNSVRVLIKDIIERISSLLEQTPTTMGYHHSYIQKITASVQNDINEYQTKNKKFKLKKEFTVDLCLHVCENAHDKFAVLHEEFQNANDPRNYIEGQKPQYYSIFKNFCRGATTTTIFGELICSKLESSILQAVYNKTAIDLAELMRSEMEALNGNRSKLEKHILKSLAEDENFEKYTKYIHNPREHFKRFIKCKVDKFINQQHQKVLTLFKTNFRLKVQTVSAAVHDAVLEVKENNGDADMWQKCFTKSLTDEMKFTGNPGVDLREITDFDFLEKILSEKLTERMSNLQNRFKSIKDMKMEKCRKKPDEILIDHFCQCCWVQCPFCAAICTNTIEDHDGDHSVPFHRNTAVNGLIIRDTTNLCINICTTAVAGDWIFYPDSSDKTVLWREYRKGGPEYANWSITPDLSELPYWKWFVCRFQKDLEKYYNKTFEGLGEIPDEWRAHSKDKALKSLDEYI